MVWLARLIDRAVYFFRLANCLAEIISHGVFQCKEIISLTLIWSNVELAVKGRMICWVRGAPRANLFW